MVSVKYFQCVANQSNPAMKALFHIIMLSLISISFIQCNEKENNDELLLWEYYKGFTYAPELFDSLSSHAHSPITKDFFSGLKCFEKYSQDEKVDCYDSAFDIFSKLMK